jgi:hypothetical protein
MKGVSPTVLYFASAFRLIDEGSRGETRIHERRSNGPTLAPRCYLLLPDLLRLAALLITVPTSTDRHCRRFNERIS